MKNYQLRAAEVFLVRNITVKHVYTGHSPLGACYQIRVLLTTSVSAQQTLPKEQIHNKTASRSVILREKQLFYRLVSVFKSVASSSDLVGTHFLFISLSHIEEFKKDYRLKSSQEFGCFHNMLKCCLGYMQVLHTNTDRSLYLMTLTPQFPCGRSGPSLWSFWFWWPA